MIVTSLCHMIHIFPVLTAFHLGLEYSNESYGAVVEDVKPTNQELMSVDRYRDIVSVAPTNTLRPNQW